MLTMALYALNFTLSSDLHVYAVSETVNILNKLFHIQPLPSL